MNIEYQKNGTTLVVKPEGRLDTATSPELERDIRPKLEGITNITMDLEKVDYISSGGLRVFLALSQMMEERGGGMKVLHVNEYIMEVFEMTGFLEILAVE